MGPVYQNAYLTIAVACSLSSDQGLFAPQTADQPFRISLSDMNGNPAVLGVRKVLQSGFHGLPSDPWYSRGWTLQEELLSTRLVTYTSKELQWTFRTLSTCECGGPKPGIRQVPEPFLFRAGDPTMAFSIWQVSMLRYSSRSLTFPSDKLVAIDGLAQTVQRIMKCDYVAGLWSANLLYDITWVREGCKANMKPPWMAPVEYRAPTWFWASVDGYISYNPRSSGFELTLNADIVSWDVQTFDGTQFGQVKDGSLQIRGHLIPGVLDQSLTRDGYHPGFRALGKDVLIAEPKALWLRLDVNTQILPYLDDNDKQPWSACRCLGISNPSATGLDDLLTKKESARLQDVRVWLLYIGHFTHTISAGKAIQMLLLLGISPRDSRKYERIGTLKGGYGSFSYNPFPNNLLQTITIL